MESNRKIIIVLGSPNDDQGNLYGVAKERCLEAYRFWKDNPDWPILLTGGFGKHFNNTDKPHAAYLKAFLVELGVAENRFLEFAQSLNTLQDASLSKPIVLDTGLLQCVVVTSDYHLPRAKFVFAREYADTEIELSFIASFTDESKGEMDYEALKAHEKASLARMMAIEEAN